MKLKKVSVTLKTSLGANGCIKWKRSLIKKTSQSTVFLDVLNKRAMNYNILLLIMSITFRLGPGLLAAKPDIIFYCWECSDIKISSVEQMMWLWSPPTVFTNTKSQKSCLVLCNCCCRALHNGCSRREEPVEMMGWQGSSWWKLQPSSTSCQPEWLLAPLNWFLWSWQWRVERVKSVASWGSGNRCEAEQLMTFSTLFCVIEHSHQLWFTENY